MKFPKLVDQTLVAAGALRPASDSAIVVGDCVPFLCSLPPACVDLIFCDPPYFLSNGGTTVRSGEVVSVDKGGWDVGQDAHVILRFHETWLRACQRVLRPSGTIWVSTSMHSLFAIGFAMQRCGFHLLNDVTWRKPNPPPNRACRTLTHSTEHVIWAAPARRAPMPHFFAYDDLRSENGDKQMKDVWDIVAPRGAEGGESKHPTQKPLELLDRVIRMSSRPGELVLDPFMGSGTTGHAARLLGRGFIGIEQDERYAGIAARRIAGVTLPAAPVEAPCPMT